MRNYLLVAVGSIDVLNKDFYVEYDILARNNAHAVDQAGWILEQLDQSSLYYEILLFEVNLHLAYSKNSKKIVKMFVPDDGYWPTGKPEKFSLLKRPSTIDFSEYDDDEDYDDGDIFSDDTF